VARTSIHLAPASSGGTISNHIIIMVVSFHGVSPRLRVACQSPLLSRIHGAGRDLTPLL
jgi:hypothetical protein